MPERGRVLRDTSNGPGLIFVGGRQVEFALVGDWKGATAPRVDMAVNLTLAEDGTLRAVEPVSERELAREAAEKALAAAKDRFGDAFSVAQRRGTPMANLAWSRVRKRPATAVAIALLAIAWCMLPTLDIHIAEGLTRELTLWSLLGALNSGPQQLMSNAGGGGAGLMGLLCVACLLAPCLPEIWRDRRAVYAGFLPVAFMILLFTWGDSALHRAISASSGMAGALGGGQAEAFAAQLATEAVQQAMRAVSFGMGAYLGVAVSLFFAGKTTLTLLARRGQAA